MSVSRTKRTDIYRRITSKRAKGTTIKPSLCFYDTHEVLNGLQQNRQVRLWLKFISNHYLPASHDVLLIYPCSADKPYVKSRSYKQLYTTLSRFGENRRRIHVVTISEPFGLVPEEFYGTRTRWHDWKNDWYDCPGLFEWWCKKYERPYSEQEANQCIEILAHNVALFLRKVKTKKRYKKIVAFVRTYSSNLKKTHDQTHRRIIERAAEISNVKLQLLPSRALISRIIRKNKSYAWDMYGVSHPQAQEYLFRKLRALLHDNE